MGSTRHRWRGPASAWAAAAFGLVLTQCVVRGPEGEGSAGAAAAKDGAVAPEASVPVPAVPAPSPLEHPRATFPPYAGHAEDGLAVHQAIENVERLDYYFGQLTLTDLKHDGAITRASQWGDSVIGGDGLTDAVRQLLQARFGDAGHGFHALSRYSVGYRHRGVRFQDHGGWESCHIIFRCRPEQRYGFGGVSTRSHGGGRSTYQTAPRGFGKNVSRFELWYGKHPEGGTFQIELDGKLQRTLDTRADSLLDAVETLLVPDGEHRFAVSATGRGVARAYGVVLERDVPGAVWDELSQIGSFTQRLDYQDAEHIAAQVARRDTDLLVFIMGGNDVQRGDGDLAHGTAKYEREYTRVIQKFRAGKPSASCLVMSLTDHGERVGDRVRSRPVMFRLVAAQRAVAEAQACAFFDTFQAMGGEGAIGRWRAARPPLAAQDLIHPSPAGQRQIATWLYRALMRGYVAYRERQTGAPLPPLDLAVPLEGEPPGRSPLLREPATGGPVNSARDAFNSTRGELIDASPRNL